MSFIVPLGRNAIWASQIFKQLAIGQVTVLEASPQTTDLIQPAIAVITVGAVDRIVKRKAQISPFDSFGSIMISQDLVVDSIDRFTDSIKRGIIAECPGSCRILHGGQLSEPVIGIGDMIVLLFATVNRVLSPILAMKLLPIPAFTSEVSKISNINSVFLFTSWIYHI